jgi:SAM-dependent methyltransferase
MSGRSAESGVSAYDLPTRDKIPAIRSLVALDDRGLALDVGSGTGYTTRGVFGARPTVCVDMDPGNLRYCREHAPAGCVPMCVVARAEALPFREGAFRFILCSEVLEHLDNDEGAAREMARVLSRDGRAIVTVPYTGLGFTTIPEWLGLKTVHDFPGPERHVRPGYDERSLGQTLGRQGLEVERFGYYLRLFARITTDIVTIAHLAFQRVVHGRRSWTWSDVSAVEGSTVFKMYTWVFPVLWGVSRLDRLLTWTRGFGLIASARKR